MKSLKLLLIACTALLVLIAIGDYRHAGQVTEHYSIDKESLERQLLERMSHSLDHVELESLEVIPSLFGDRLGLTLKAQLPRFSEEIGETAWTRLSLDLRMHLQNRRLILWPACLRSSEHNLPPQLAEDARETTREVLRSWVDMPLEEIAPRGQGRPITHIKERDGLIHFSAGLYWPSGTFPNNADCRN